MSWEVNGGSLVGQDQKQQDSRIEDFLESQSAKNGLDERTVKAYRLDLGLFYAWLGEREIWPLDRKAAELYLDYLSREKKLRASTVTRKYRVLGYYLEYLSREGQLPPYRPLPPPVPTPQTIEKEEKAGVPGMTKKAGTVKRAEEIRAIAASGTREIDGADVSAGAAWAIEDMGTADVARTGIQKGKKEGFLSKVEVDSFFVALDREYEELDSDFRRRVCLRDRVMMELLFYHGLEISEVLRLELTDYDEKTGILRVRRKRGKDRDQGGAGDQGRDGRDAEEPAGDRDRRDAGDRDRRDAGDRVEENDGDTDRIVGKGRGRRRNKERSVRIFSKELRGRMDLWIREHGYFERVSEHKDVMFLSKLGKPLSMKMVISIFDKYRIMAGIERECKPKDLKRSMERYARELMVERCS